MKTSHGDKSGILGARATLPTFLSTVLFVKRWLGGGGADTEEIALCDDGCRVKNGSHINIRLLILK